MSFERTLFSGHARLPAGGVDTRCQAGGLIDAGTKPKPDHAREAPSAERAGIAETELKPGTNAFQPTRHRLDHGAIDAADKPDRHMQVLRRHPPKVRRQLRAAGDETAQVFTLTIGHREPEEGANLQRARGFFQFSWTHELGRVGRQP